MKIQQHSYLPFRQHFGFPKIIPPARNCAIFAARPTNVNPLDNLSNYLTEHGKHQPEGPFDPVQPG